MSDVTELSALGQVALEFAHHKDAPDFKKNDPWVLMNQLIVEVTSKNFKATEELRSLFYQAGLVSLWFYLKYIASYAGPYGDLNDSIHVDICNFRQVVATSPGIYSALIVPRAVFKSTIAGHGASSWELVRNPDLRIGYAGAIADRAARCVSLVGETFSKNEFHQWIYPEHVKANRSADTLILKNRKRNATDPNMQTITAGGSVQGIHVDLFVGDDIVGDDMLNADHISTADMQRNVNWFVTNHKTLLINIRKSRVLSIATRYAVDDVSEFIMKDTKVRCGYWEGLPYEWPAGGGKWTTYYRPCSHPDDSGVERSIFPEAFSLTDLAQMAEEDPWTYHTQYANRPHDTGSAEFASYNVPAVRLVQITGKGLCLDFGIGVDGKTDIEPLKYCSVVTATDPSGGLAGGRKSSRAAIAVIAVTPKGRRVVVDADAGFVSTTKYIGWMFQMKRLYEPYNSILETQGPFKALIPVIRDNEKRNKFNLFLRPVDSLGNKEDTIRAVLQPQLQLGNLYVCDKVRGKVMEELKVFPSRRMDLLDAIKLGVHYCRAPNKEEAEKRKSYDALFMNDQEDDELYEDELDEIMQVRSEERRRMASANRVTGY